MREFTHLLTSVSYVFYKMSADKILFTSSAKHHANANHLVISRASILSICPDYDVMIAMHIAKSMVAV